MLFFIENKKHTLKNINSTANMFNTLFKFHQENSYVILTYFPSAKQLNLKFLALVFNVLLIYLMFSYTFSLNNNINTLNSIFINSIYYYYL